MNKVILIGNLGKDSELAYTQTQVPVLNFSIATTEKAKDTEKTEWHRCTMFGPRAEKLKDYLKKGVKVVVDGKIQYRQSEGKDGMKYYYTDIVVGHIEFVGGKKEHDYSQEFPIFTRNKEIEESAPF